MKSVGSSNHSLLRVGSSDLFSLPSPPHDLIQAHLLNSPCLDYPQMCISSLYLSLKLDI